MLIRHRSIVGGSGSNSRIISSSVCFCFLLGFMPYMVFMAR